MRYNISLFKGGYLMDKKKSLIAKILIPILIAVAIIAIFIAKNMQKSYN